jgi:hypothetical protein
VEERYDLCRFGVGEPGAQLHVRYNLQRFLQVGNGAVMEGGCCLGDVAEHRHAESVSIGALIHCL